MGDPQKVLYLTATGRMGGAEQSLLELLSAMPKERVEPHVACPPDGPMASLLAEAGIAAHEVGFRRYRRTLHPFLLAGQIKALFLSSAKVARLCDKLGIRLLHANTDSAAIVAWEVCRSGRWPFLWHSRDLKPLGRVGRLLGTRASRVIAISGAVAAHLSSQRVPREKLRLVVNGIDLSRFTADALRGAREAARSELGVPAGSMVLISAGMFVPWKRHEEFLSLIHILKKKRRNVCGILAGNDLFDQNEAYAASLRETARELDLGDAVRFVGYRSDVPRLLAAADIFVSTSEHEPFGRAVVEAMAAGAPVVATYSGAKGEVVVDGQTGHLVPQGRMGALVAACESLLDDEATRRSFGERGRERASERFDVSRTAREIADVYDEVLNRDAPEAAHGEGRGK